MALNNNALPNLSRFSIGEIVDLAGVPIFYNAGSSTWLQSGQLTSSSNLTASTKTNLIAAGTSAQPTVIAQSSLSYSYNVFGMYATYPIARISASSISVVPSYYTGTTAVGVGVATSTGLQVVATGQTSIRAAGPTSGGNGVVASNNTTIFSYTFTSATALSAYTTTTGTSWASASVTGLPTFAADGSTIAIASEVNSGSATVTGHAGWKRAMTSYAQFGVFWCGARFLLIGPGATNYVCSLSTDGLAFGGDNTTAVIGATGQGKFSANIQFYRNGNNCYLNIGTAYRYSTDGGITWAACTFAAAPSPTSYYIQYNQTDPAKMVIWLTSGYPAYYTADSGATWSANRALPSDNISGGLAYRGSTLVASNNSSTTFVSTNDGVSWAPSTLPIGTLGTNTNIMVDANRFYLGIYDQAQLLTSSDGVTWTIVTIPQSYQIVAQGGFVGPGIVSFDSNTVALIGYSNATGYSQFFSTTDGGVTWSAGQFTANNTGGYWQGGNVYTTPDAGGIGFYLGSNLAADNGPKVFRSDITSGGAFFRTGVSVIAPTRTNAKAYVRVG